MKLVSKMINLNISIKKGIPGNNLSGASATSGEWLTFKEGTCTLTKSQEERLIEIAGETKTLKEWIRSLKTYGTDFIEVDDDVVVAPKSSEPDHYTMVTENGRLEGQANHRNDNSIYNKATIQELIKAESAKMTQATIQQMMPDLINMVKENLVKNNPNGFENVIAEEPKMQAPEPIKIPKPIEPVKPWQNTEESMEGIEEIEEEEDITNDDIISDIEIDNIIEEGGVYYFKGKKFSTRTQAEASKRMTEMHLTKARSKKTA